MTETELAVLRVVANIVMAGILVVGALNLFRVAMAALVYYIVEKD
jgi:hypothetical protein